VNTRRLLEDLAINLQRIVPADVTVSADDRYVIVDIGGRFDYLNVVDVIECNIEIGHNEDQAIQIAVERKIDDLQDILTEHTTWPWPPGQGLAPSEFASVNVELVSDALHIWFGDRRNPVFPVITISLE